MPRRVRDGGPWRRDIETYYLARFPVDADGVPQRAETPILAVEGELAPYLRLEDVRGLV